MKGGLCHFTSILLNLNGLELDKQTIEGKTALMFAVTGGQINVVQRLLSCGSDFSLEDTVNIFYIAFSFSFYKQLNIPIQCSIYGTIFQKRNPLNK